MMFSSVGDTTGHISPHVSENRSTSSGERYEGDVPLPAVGADSGSADKFRPRVTADLLQSPVCILFIKAADGHKVLHDSISFI